MTRTHLVNSKTTTKEKIPYSKELIESFLEDCNCYETEGSEVAKFFSGKYIFITGGTGFIGKLTIEKLLRACPEISGIFMLVRAKKGKDVHTRVEELFHDVVFKRLAKKHPKFQYKIFPVAGDVGLEGLGIRTEDRKAIIEKVNVIFHAAATVRFDEKLNIANNVNVKGTVEVLTLAKECQNLVSFVHVSTAYSNYPNMEIKEIFYDHPMTAEKLTSICDNMPLEILEKITPDLLGEWPNTYSYTKAIAEDVVRKLGINLPVCIFRPSVVIPTYKEPLKGWTDNIYGPTGYILGCGIGLIRAANVDASAIADIVPADFVVNGMIVAAYQNAIETQNSIEIYNCVSSVQQPITWKEYAEWSAKYGEEFGSIKGVWCYSLLMIQNKALYSLYAFLVHTIPAYFVDLVTILLGKKPQMLKIYKKIHKFNDALSSFATRKLNFSNDNIQKLYNSLSDVDRKFFNFDMKTLDWLDFMKAHGLGIREYLVKDPLSTVESGRKRYIKFKILHYTLLTVLAMVVLNVVRKFLCYIYEMVF